MIQYDINSALNVMTNIQNTGYPPHREKGPCTPKISQGYLDLSPLSYNFL